MLRDATMRARHIVALSLAFLAGCGAADPEVDASTTFDAAPGVTCDCCGHPHEAASFAECTAGTCDPWCVAVNPCGDDCTGPQWLCLVRPGILLDASVSDAGSSGPGAHCLERPDGCEGLADCARGTCDASTCLAIFSCAPGSAVVSEDGDVLYCAR